MLEEIVCNKRKKELIFIRRLVYLVIIKLDFKRRGKKGTGGGACPTEKSVYILSGALTPKMLKPFLITFLVATASAILASASFFSVPRILQNV